MVKIDRPVTGHHTLAPLSRGFKLSTGGRVIAPYAIISPRLAPYRIESYRIVSHSYGITATQLHRQIALPPQAHRMSVKSGGRDVCASPGRAGVRPSCSAVDEDESMSIAWPAEQSDSSGQALPGTPVHRVQAFLNSLLSIPGGDWTRLDSGLASGRSRLGRRSAALRRVMRWPRSKDAWNPRTAADASAMFLGRSIPTESTNPIAHHRRERPSGE